MRYFGSRNYDWSGLSEQKTVIGKAKRSILQFSPHSWDDFDWRLTSSPLRCMQCLFPIFLILLMEVGYSDVFLAVNCQLLRSLFRLQLPL